MKVWTVNWTHRFTLSMSHFFSKLSIKISLWRFAPVPSMTENCAPVSIWFRLTLVTSRGPLRTRFESVAMCGSQAPVGWGRTQQLEPATERAAGRCYLCGLIEFISQRTLLVSHFVCSLSIWNGGKDMRDPDLRCCCSLRRKYIVCMVRVPLLRQHCCSKHCSQSIGACTG